MVAEGSFKHIVVHASEDDEVIEAGIVSEDSALEEDEIIDTSEAPEDATPTQAPAEILDDQAQQRLNDISGDRSSLHEATAQKPSSEAQQMLEDLKTEPRSLTQRIVIVCAIILIIVAVAYYFLVMR